MKSVLDKIKKILFVTIYFATLYLPIFEKVEITPSATTVSAGNFQMQTGGYVGKGYGLTISGLGFSPDLVIVKPATTAGGGAMFKTSAMQDTVEAFYVATANGSGGITLENDGFSVQGTNVNSAGVYHTWVAFGGSDCSETGNFCVGAYVGNGTSPRLISSVGFQPDAVWVKPSGATAAMLKTSTMSANYAQYFTATAQSTDGAFFTTLASSGFNVGASLNTASTVYYYVAFKNTTDLVAVGSYSGTGVAQNIDVGFVPDFVMLKDAAALAPVYSLNESYGRMTYYFTDTASLAAGITGLISSPVSGFSLDTNAACNTSGNTIYWLAFGGASDTRSSSGTFKMARGTYTGTGTTGDYISVDNVGFAPDLVIVKGDTTQVGVFRTSAMPGDYTTYFSTATASFTGGIVSLDPDGFTIGNSAVVNTSGATYYWEAYGNAWNARSHSGASDFFIGAYLGTGLDSTDITRQPCQADMITVKANTTQAGVFKISDQSTDLSGSFGATAEAANIIQAINTDGFEIGTSATVNTASTIYYYFGFKESSNFAVGTYSGNGGTSSVNVGFQPEYLWVKNSSTNVGITRDANLSGDGVYPFTNVAKVTGGITGITSTGFDLSSSAYVNASGTNNYRYVAWKGSQSPTTPTFQIQTGGYTGDGGTLSIAGLGFSPDLVIVKPATNAGVGAIFKTSAMIDNVDAVFIATANSAGAINLDPDGFTVMGANSNTANVYHTWVAIGGSDCSSSGSFCVGAYIGNGTSPRLISTVGFQPDQVWVKPSGATATMWRSSSMATNYAQYFSATIGNTDGSFFTTLASNGFNVGASLNTSASIYYYVAFKNVTNKISVGSYSGTGVAQNIDVGFVPDFVFLKNSATTGSPIYNVTESWGKTSYYYTDTACLAGGITGLISTPVSGFGVDTSALSNASGNTIYWVAFGGASDLRSSSGTFKMARGTYTGTGTTGDFIKINNLNFKPDLVIVKGDTTQVGVFRTSTMQGDSTAYMSSTTANFSGGIVMLDYGGFTIGASAVVNTSGATYYWEAYGNAWNAKKNTGAADFYVGSYLGSGNDNADITKRPYAIDLLAIKANAAYAGAFKISDQTTDLSSFFAGTAEAANVIQVLDDYSFQLGTSTSVNNSLSIYNFFGFKEGSNFAVGTYSGNGGTSSVNVGFQPEYLWVKNSSTNVGISRDANLSGDGVYPFTNVAKVTGGITGITSTGFDLSSSAYVNASGTNNYRYVAWRAPAEPVISITVTDGSIAFGNIPFGESKATTSLSDTQSVTNNGNVTVTVSVKGENAPCPWTLGSNVGSEQYRYDFSTNSGTDWTPLTTSYVNMKTGLTASSSQNFDLRLWAPTTTTCTTQQSINMTLQATQE